MTTVLVATERELEFNVISQTLAGQGYELIRCKDGIDAIEAIRTHRASLLLANVLLPKLDGFALYRRCKQDEQLRGLPVVLFSTRSNDVKSERFASEMGVKHFLGNALKSAQLAPMLAAALSDKSQSADSDLLAGTGPIPVAAVQQSNVVPNTSAAHNEPLKLVDYLDSPRVTPEKPASELSAPGRPAVQRADTELFQLNPTAMWIVDKASQSMLAVNDAALRLFGYERQEFMQLNSDALLKASEPQNATQVKTFQTKDGRALSLLLAARDLTYAKHAAELFTAHDVSYRVRGERALADELRRQRVLLAAVPTPYLLLNGANRVVDANEAALKALGCRREQVQDMDFRNLLADAEASIPTLTNGTSFQTELKLEGSGKLAAEVMVSRVDMVGDVRMLMLRILPAAPAQAETRQPARKLPVVIEMLRYAEDADEATLLHYAMVQLAFAFESPLALFCGVEQVTQTIEVLAIKQTPAPRTPYELGTTVRVPLPWTDLVNTAGVYAQTEADDTMLVNGLPEISSYCACSVPGVGRESMGRPAWLLVMANREQAFSVDEQQELRECADVLATLVARKRAQFKVHAAQQRLAASQEGMVALIERLVDAQDVYAIGSGRRVAALATAIARQMELSGDKISALVLAARLHDVGHLALPRELFLLPRPLTVAERALVKTHIEHGARMLRTVDFGVDVGSIVAQHHERVDGSGYPMGLRGDQMLLEARILAVADVMDAITSARAHRPAQDTEVALAELRNGAGTRYDESVVAVCEAVFAGNEGNWPV